MPQSPLPRKEQRPDEFPQSSLQAQLIHEQQVPLEEVQAQEGAGKEPEIQKKHPIHIRPMYVLMQDVTTTSKWYAHDQFKSDNQVKEVAGSKEAVTSKRQLACKYPNVDDTKWSKD
jgi:hypothetical protein